MRNCTTGLYEPKNPKPKEGRGLNQNQRTGADWKPGHVACHACRRRKGCLLRSTASNGSTALRTSSVKAPTDSARRHWTTRERHCLTRHREDTNRSKGPRYNARCGARATELHRALETPSPERRGAKTRQGKGQGTPHTMHAETMQN